MIFQVRKNHYETYICYKVAGEWYNSKTNDSLDTFQQFDKVLCEGTQKDCYAYYLHEVILCGEPI